MGRRDAEVEAGTAGGAASADAGGVDSPLRAHPELDAFVGDDGDRPRAVRSLFDRTARGYDRIDAVTSLGTGNRYRERALRGAGVVAGMRVLDVGCGTGLVARPAARIVGGDGYVLGVDPSEGMRAVASQRGGFETVEGTAESLPVEDGSFDMVTMGYALRHISSLSTGFGEFSRALKPGGGVAILEITAPRSVLGRVAIRVAMRWVVPAVAAVVTLSTDSWRLMRYFWATIDRCVPPEEVMGSLRSAGFEDVVRSVELGVFSVYTGRKPKASVGDDSGDAAAVGIR